jgi:hypothetical protein
MIFMIPVEQTTPDSAHGPSVRALRHGGMPRAAEAARQPVSRP